MRYDVVDVVIGAAIGAVVLATVAFVLALGGIVYGSFDQSSRLSHAKTVAAERCEGAAQTYDVEGEARLVYACADGKLKVMEYGADFWPYW